MWYIWYMCPYIHIHIYVCVYIYMCIYIYVYIYIIYLSAWYFHTEKCWWLRTPASCTAPTAILQFPALIRGLEKWWQPIAPCMEDSRLYGMTSACKWLCETHLCLFTVHTILFYLKNGEETCWSVVYKSWRQEINELLFRMCRVLGRGDAAGRSEAFFWFLINECVLFEVLPRVTWCSCFGCHAAAIYQAASEN